MKELMSLLEGRMSPAWLASGWQLEIYHCLC